MEQDKNIFTQEELNKLKINEDVKQYIDVQNLIILIRNELNTLEIQIPHYQEKLQTRISKKLNKILNEIIEIRKQ